MILKATFAKLVKTQKPETWQICCYRPGKGKESKGGSDRAGKLGKRAWICAKEQVPNIPED